MATITKFEDLEAWQLCRELCGKVFDYTNRTAFSKDYALKDQINRSSGSAMDNVAEGFGRGSRNEFVNFLSFTCGSLTEVKSQLHRALDRNYITQKEFDEAYELADKAYNKTGSFIQYLNKSSLSGPKFKNRVSLTNDKQ
jgi:four helix bundle protein